MHFCLCWLSDPNAHIVWLDNADAKLKALRDIEEGMEKCSDTFMAIQFCYTGNLVHS